MAHNPQDKAHELLVALAQGGRLELKNAFGGTAAGQKDAGEAAGAYIDALYRSLVKTYSQE
ncbi:hypothetical protein PHO31112_00766 [Pandoraea horticolens]|uniref:Uncharacterized protein n=1 Tax=Pandoraea horticolens TaxID=2508298 RepID=A0A5E4SK03_9BURK|nr:hypothetical protein [Pandoraea horticolens]VVD74568.1 hypothetical protein PHO31112_00766 [Pandoraea horticolens]